VSFSGDSFGRVLRCGEGVHQKDRKNGESNYFSICAWLALPFGLLQFSVVFWKDGCSWNVLREWLYDLLGILIVEDRNQVDR
jgi:hypothetical protein